MRLLTRCECRFLICRAVCLHVRGLRAVLVIGRATWALLEVLDPQLVSVDYDAVDEEDLTCDFANQDVSDEN